MHSQKIDGKKFATDNHGMIDSSRTSLSPQERRESYPYRAEHVAAPNYDLHRADMENEEACERVFFITNMGLAALIGLLSHAYVTDLIERNNGASTPSHASAVDDTQNMRAALAQENFSRQVIEVEKAPTTHTYSYDLEFRDPRTPDGELFQLRFEIHSEVPLTPDELEEKIQETLQKYIEMRRNPPMA